MRSFKKVMVSVITIVVLFSLISAVIICPYINSETFYYEDKDLRANLSGTLDYLIIGSSHGLSAFKTSVLDEELGCNSYNLSGGMMTFAARKFLLQKELERNPIHTVVIEVSHNALTSENDDGYGEGDSAFLPRLDSFSERVRYLVKSVKIDDWLNIYSKLFIQGLSYYKHRGTIAVDYAAKGYHAKETRDITLSENLIAEKYNSGMISTAFTDYNIRYLEQMIACCKDHDARVIIAVVPIADVSIWGYNNIDDFDIWLKNFCVENDCECYNFNLLRDRYQLFNDATSFYDGAHLSDPGATVFTRAYVDIIQKTDKGEDVSPLFFNNYEELKKFSPYMDYLQKNS